MSKRKSPLRCAVLETPEPRNVVCSFCLANSLDLPEDMAVITCNLGAICDLCVEACVEFIAEAKRRWPEAAEAEYLSWGVTP